MSSAPTLNGQVIGQAHYATRAVLEGRLARTGITFHQVVALNAIADNGGAVERDWPVGRMTGTLKIDESAAGAKIAELTTAGLLEALPAVAGEELASGSRTRARCCTEGPPPPPPRSPSGSTATSPPTAWRPRVAC